MIYSKDDVKRMLDKVWELTQTFSFHYKNDKLPPKVIMEEDVKMILKSVGESL